MKLFKKEKKPKYPIPFGLITFTPEALDEGVEDEQNKVILVYDYNFFGKLVERKYSYTDSRLLVLENKGIPIHDKTKSKARFPVYNRIMPGEATYTGKW